MAHAELYMGLVEIGVGLLPSAGGCLNLWKNHIQHLPEAVNDMDWGKFFVPVFMTIGLAKVSTSAADARSNGFLEPGDRIVFNRDHLIGEAKREVLKMVAEGYVPPVKRRIPVMGESGQGMIAAELYNMKKAGFISEYDAYLAERVAFVLSGGQVRTNTLVDEETILTLERQNFLALLKQDKTIARIEHMLKTGKPLAELILNRDLRNPIYLWRRIIMQEAYIVSSVRTPGCKRVKGAFKDTLPQDLLAFILDAAVAKVPGLEKKDVEDVMAGCAFPEADQGLNIGRIAAQMAGFPDQVPGATINRFCSSGLEAIAQCAMRIMAGWVDTAIGAGVESMTYVPMVGYMPRPHPDYSRQHAGLYASMGITAENVARRYKVSREEQDEFACNSHIKAAAAQAEGRFTEIVPTPAVRFDIQKDGTYKKNTFIQSQDDGVRANATEEGLKTLHPVFTANGTVTAGNSSQMTDGAAATVLMSHQQMKALGVSPIAKFKHCAVVGCRPMRWEWDRAMPFPNYSMRRDWA